MAAHTIPADLQYTPEHEWLRPESGEGEQGEDVVTVGITHYAQEQLGDIVYVALPEPGATVAPGDSVGELESTKSVSDVYAPAAGVVMARNEELESTPELVNSDPYGRGWLFTMRLDEALAEDELLTAEGYADHLA